MNWISINEHLPPEGQAVLFTCQYDEDETWFQEVNIGYYEGSKTMGNAIAMEVGDHDWSPCTHWMPLPQMPEVSQ